MAQYINKSIIAAEIKKRIKEGEAVVENVPSSAIMGLIQAYKNVLSFLDTLEVKEVELEKEIIADDISHIVQHYSELGLKTKGDGRNR